MNTMPTAIPDVWILEPRVFHDGRGFFFESFNQRAFEAATQTAYTFVQDNHSRSVQHTLRGLHYQLEQAQGKLIRVVQGKIYDAVVDLRQSSPTYGQWVGITLDSKTQHQLWVPPGFAHGFYVVSPMAEVLYKTTDYYHPASERTLMWNDPQLAIPWPLGGTPILSTKDQRGQSFAEVERFP